MIEIFDGICEIIDDLRPIVWRSRNSTHTTIDQLHAILMGHARGAIFLAAAKRDLQVFPYPATKIKKTLTGMDTHPRLKCKWLSNCS